MGTPWQIIHFRFPVICEGEPGRRKGRYAGCCTWNEFQDACNTRVTNGGVCNLSVEQAIEKEKSILKGQI